MPPTEKQKAILERAKIDMKLAESLKLAIDFLEKLKAHPGGDQKAIADSIVRNQEAYYILTTRCGKEPFPDKIKSKTETPRAVAPAETKKGEKAKEEMQSIENTRHELDRIKRAMSDKANRLHKELEDILKEEQLIKKVLKELKTVVEEAIKEKNHEAIIEHVKVFGGIWDPIIKTILKIREKIFELIDKDEGQQRMVDLLERRLINERQLTKEEREILAEIRERSARRQEGLDQEKHDEFEKIAKKMDAISRTILLPLIDEANKGPSNPAEFVKKVAKNFTICVHLFEEVQEKLDKIREIIIKEMRYFRKVDRGQTEKLLKLFEEDEEKIKKMLKG